MKLNKVQRYSADIYETLCTLFDEDSENHKFDLNEIDLTAFFQAMFMANNMFYQQITEDKGDLLDFLSLNQRLVFQYLQENGKERDEQM